jgi:pSer/pThr/pTyr-binding forkhead associated (FHA) protein/tetratricopeptide (TPR) repeat protein
MTNLKLQIRDEEGRTTVVPFIRGEITVGRQEGNTIRLTERNVSRQHAKLVRQNGHVYLEDLSKYGTRINGQVVQQRRTVENGDVIQIGDYELCIQGDTQLRSTVPEISVKDVDMRRPTEGAKALAAKPDQVEKPVGESTSVVDLNDLARQEREQAGQRKRVMADVPMLVALNTELAGKEFALKGAEVVIGRTDDNAMVVDHRSISRNHARITIEGRRVTLYDLDSANGIKVNGDFYKQSVLHKGDVVELGNVKFRYVEPGETYVYEADQAVEAAADAPAGGKGKLWLILGGLVVVAGGLAVAYVTVFNKPPEAPKGPTPATVAEPSTPAQGPARPVSTQPAVEVKPVTPEASKTATPPATPETAPGKAVDVSAELAEAEGSFKAEKWDEAMKAFQAVLAKDPTKQEAKDGLGKALGEKTHGQAYDAAKEAAEKGDFDAAWAELEKLAEVKAGSAYHARAGELKKSVNAKYLEHLLSEGMKKLKAKRFKDALQDAENALGIDPEHAGANQLQAAAKKALLEGKPLGPETRPPEPVKPAPVKPAPVKPAPVKPEPVKPEPVPAPKADGAKSATDLYKDGQANFSSDPAKAMDFFQQAAAKGSVRAWQRIGALHLSKGRTQEAVTAFKKYLTLAPSAQDAEAVRATIIRLGGTPP